MFKGSIGKSGHQPVVYEAEGGVCGNAYRDSATYKDLSREQYAWKWIVGITEVNRQRSDQVATTTSCLMSYLSIL